MSWLRQLVRSAPLLSFTAITFAFTWSLLPFASRSIGVSLVALFGPAVGAVVTSWLAGPDEWRSLRRRAFNWRLGAGWYLIALGVPVIVSTIRSLGERLAGAPGALELQPVTPLSVVVFVLVFGEELGWRGFALPRLTERHGPWVASMAVGITWAVWHLPLFFMPGMPQFGSPFGAFVFYTVGLSLWLTWLAIPTRVSVVLATVFHGAVNTFGIVVVDATPAQRGWSNAISYLTVGVLIGAIAWRRRAGVPVPRQAA